MRDVVGELVKTLMADQGWKPGKPGADGSDDEVELTKDGATGGGGSSSAAPADFFQTLPPRQDKQQLGAAQKLQWLQLASMGDPLNLDGNMYCSLCSEPLLMEAVVSTPCKHHFHRICLKRVDLPQCPLCATALPFSWFLPTDHPCAENGFRVVPARGYKPAFPGGPSRGTGGYPLHRPPPMQLFGPEGIMMKSYLHKTVPMGDPEAQETSSPPLRPAASPDDETAEEGDGAGSSESSSEDSNSENGDETFTGLGTSSGSRAQQAAGSRRGRPKAWAYSAIGRMRLCERPAAAEGTSPLAPPRSSPLPSQQAIFGSPKEAFGEAHATSGSEGAAPAGGNGGAGPSSSSAAWGSQLAEQRNPRVLLIGDHL